MVSLCSRQQAVWTWECFALPTPEYKQWLQHAKAADGQPSKSWESPTINGGGVQQMVQEGVCMG